MSTAAEKGNLARIRDNQRRSRARRKEYLQELETKLRMCELHGVEASTEIQVAARRVASENKKLRALLLQNGVSEDSIEAFLSSTESSTASSEMVIPSQSSDRAANSVQVLEQQLLTRPCCTTLNGPQKDGICGRGSRDSSCSPSTVQPPPWNHPQNLDGLYSDAFGPSPERSSASTIRLRYSPDPESHQGLPQMPGDVDPDLANLPDPQAAQIPDYDLHSQLQVPVQYETVAHQNYLEPLVGAQGSSSCACEAPSAATTNVSSCVFVADLLTTMTGDDSLANISADLGCPPDIDCEVDNHVVFDVMDRYTNSGAGYDNHRLANGKRLVD